MVLYGDIITIAELNKRTKAGRRMSHLANCHRLQTLIPLYTAHLKPVPRPLVRAGKIVIYAN